MYTLGYSFKPWVAAKSIADGPSILNYVRETARDNGIEKNIRFYWAVKSANWSSEDARWIVQAESGAGESVTATAGFLFMCSGYYRPASNLKCNTLREVKCCDGKELQPVEL
ncbi:MAG: hypothetical protein ACSLE5_13420 [Porticoccaceae bacterium]